MKKLSLSLAVILLSATASVADGLHGARFLTSNLFQGNDTDGIEVDVAAFGLTNNLFTTVGNGVELPGFITLYDVDVSKDAISFNWIKSEFSNQVGGVMPSDKHDRNYFTFDLPEGVEITGITFDADGSNLAEGSALPTATLISGNKVMTEFADGVIRVEGFAPRFIITTSDS